MSFLSKYTIVAFCVLLLSCSDRVDQKQQKTIPGKTSINPNNNTAWQFSSVKGSVLKFKQGKSFDTHLFELAYIGQISNGNKPPFLIFSGRDCDEWDANISIYIHSPVGKEFKEDDRDRRYSYPGLEKDFADNKPLSESKTFYGQVLPSVYGVIWYQNDLMEDKSWQRSTFVVQIENGVIKEETIKGDAQLKLTHLLLRKGLCIEIKGKDHTSEP